MDSVMMGGTTRVKATDRRVWSYTADGICCQHVPSLARSLARGVTRRDNYRLDAHSTHHHVQSCLTFRWFTSLLFHWYTHTIFFSLFFFEIRHPPEIEKKTKNNVKVTEREQMITFCKNWLYILLFWLYVITLTTCTTQLCKTVFITLDIQLMLSKLNVRHLVLYVQWQRIVK